MSEVIISWKGRRNSVMLNAALICIALGLMVLGINWTGVAEMSAQNVLVLHSGRYALDGNSCDDKAPGPCMVRRRGKYGDKNF